MNHHYLQLDLCLVSAKGQKVVYNKNIIKVNKLNKERIKSKVPIGEKCAGLMTVSKNGTEEVYGY